ncbi:MAG: hypothetical protein A2W05_02300 [Candidatus Schekmanbacteria bacterium RBG_16_38_10]|uniref:YgiT-type zinc finger domain-containing protein n=1 Tax=Candidatus Schekmanbacteria bacterium RBG_16_38_10 TaxID=1817879 RepID=A0A1F7RMR5_9BACT|nr:MAG: hypothetical protein A2W05_02300 [Candidatus Schekmanbacteria bacterium RBG_16_38_10]
MKCLYCDGQMERKLSTYTINRKGFHLYLEEIPAYVCTRCGEKAYDEDEVESIQNMIKKLEEDISKVRATI